MEKQVLQVKQMDTGRQQLTSLQKEELMSRITLSNLTAIERSIAIASIEKKVRDYSEVELTVLITGLIQRTHANCGQKDDEGLLDMTIDELVSDLKKYNTNVSFQEIELAFNSGYKGAYGEYFGLNNKTYFGWINAFTWSVERKKAKTFFKPVEVVVELTQQQKDKVSKACVLELFGNFKKSGSVNDVGGVNYDYLDRMGLIPFRFERKKEIKQQAIAVLRKQAADKKMSAKGMFAIRDATRELEEIKSGDSTLITFECKRIALNVFFKELVDMGEDLSDLLNDK